VFFRVSEIQVVGDTRYSRAEIIAASEIEFGSHLFFLREDAVRENILSRLPYAGHVEMARRFPSRIVITVREALPVAFLWTEGGYIILDRSARILERVDSRPIQRLVFVEGLRTPVLPRAGEILSLGEEGRTQLQYLQGILGAFSIHGLVPWVSVLDMQDVYNPQFYYDGRFTVLLGPNRNLQHKMDMFVGIVATMDDDEFGVIDLQPERPVFRQE